MPAGMRGESAQARGEHRAPDETGGMRCPRRRGHSDDGAVESPDVQHARRHRCPEPENCALYASPTRPPRHPPWCGGRRQDARAWRWRGRHSDMVIGAPLPICCYRQNGSAAPRARRGLERLDSPMLGQRSCTVARVVDERRSRTIATSSTSAWDAASGAATPEWATRSGSSRLGRDGRPDELGVTDGHKSALDALHRCWANALGLIEVAAQRPQVDARAAARERAHMRRNIDEGHSRHVACHDAESSFADRNRCMQTSSIVIPGWRVAPRRYDGATLPSASCASDPSCA